MDPLLTRQEVAKTLKMSVPQIDRLIRDGRITHVKIGRRVLVPEQAIADFIAAHTRIGRGNT